VLNIVIIFLNPSHLLYWLILKNKLEKFMIVHVKNLFFYSKIKYIFEPPYTFFLFEYKLEMFFFLKKKGKEFPPTTRIQNHGSYKVTDNFLKNKMNWQGRKWHVSN